MGKITDVMKKIGIFTSENANTHKKGQSESSKHHVYNLAFVKEDDGVWYIDLPNWKGPHSNLSMVAGADLLLDHLCNTDNRVEVDVVKSNEPLSDMDAYFECKQINSQLLCGATYEVSGVENFSHTIWICPVTLFVLGEYPQYIYVRQTK
jgi:hypothetical protein